MNIFILDADPVVAARYQHDKHVVKMVLESAQILSTVAHEHNLTFPLQYKPTHVKHPCVVWAGFTIANARWLVCHALALANEYTFRYGRKHKSLPVILNASNVLVASNSFISNELTPFAQAMPDAYRNPDAVVAYRKYYVAEKISPISKWTNRNKPAWSLA